MSFDLISACLGIEPHDFYNEIRSYTKDLLHHFEAFTNVKPLSLEKPDDVSNKIILLTKSFEHIARQYGQEFWSIFNEDEIVKFLVQYWNFVAAQKDRIFRFECYNVYDKYFQSFQNAIESKNVHDRADFKQLLCCFLERVQYEMDLCPSFERFHSIYRFFVNCNYFITPEIFDRSKTLNYLRFNQTLLSSIVGGMKFRAKFTIPPLDQPDKRIEYSRHYYGLCNATFWVVAQIDEAKKMSSGVFSPEVMSEFESQLFEIASLASQALLKSGIEKISDSDEGFVTAILSIFTDNDVFEVDNLSKKIFSQQPFQDKLAKILSLLYEDDRLPQAANERIVDSICQIISRLTKNEILSVLQKSKFRMVVKKVLNQNLSSVLVYICLLSTFKDLT